MKRIEIIINPQGESRIESQGFVGSSCRDATKFIEDALGKRSSEHLTSEFYLTQSTEQRQQEQA